jgi:hypothetical protein
LEYFKNDACLPRSAKKSRNFCIVVFTTPKKRDA